MQLDPPVITVIVVTYNHERFIAQALDGALRQHTDVPVEYLVSEDASTDGTRAIVLRYAQDNPGRVRVLLSDRRLNHNAVTLRAIDAARGRYLAIMDGDDVWTDSSKLDRQFRFLESHPDCSVCFHDVGVIDADGRTIEGKFVADSVGAETGLSDLLRGNYIPGSAQMIRREALSPIPSWVADSPYCDWALLIAAARHGRIGFMPEMMGSYRRHAGGTWSGLTEIQQVRGILGFYDHLEPAIWPEVRNDLRYARACWRLNLINQLDRQQRVEEIDSALADGLASGDFAGSTMTAQSPGFRTDLTVRVVAAPRDRSSQPVSPLGCVDDVQWNDRARALTVVGWGPFFDDGRTPALLVESANRIQSVSAVRLYRPDVARTVDVSLVKSGFWLRIVHNEDVAGPIRLIGITGQGGQHTIGLIGTEFARSHSSSTASIRPSVTS